MRYECHISRAVVFGPSSYSGLGLRHLYTEMMGMKIETLISHLQAQSTLRGSFQIIFNMLHLAMGLESPLFESSQQIVFIDHICYSTFENTYKN
jgi:hypothetical protein